MPLFGGAISRLARRRWLVGAIVGALTLVVVLVGIRLLAGVHGPRRVDVVISAGALGLIPGYVFATLLTGMVPGVHAPDWYALVGGIVLNPVVYGWTWSAWSPSSPASNRTRFAVVGLWMIHVALVMMAAHKMWS